MIAERLQRPLAREWQRRAGSEQAPALDERPDVLAEPVESAAEQPDVGRHALVPGRFIDLQVFELIALDDQRHVS